MENRFSTESWFSCLVLMNFTPFSRWTFSHSCSKHVIAICQSLTQCSFLHLLLCSRFSHANLSVRNSMCPDVAEKACFIAFEGRAVESIKQLIKVLQFCCIGAVLVNETHHSNAALLNRVATAHGLNAILFPPSSENTALDSCLCDFKAVCSLYRRF